MSAALSVSGVAGAESTDVSVTADRSRMTTQIGHSVVFSTTITNDATTATAPLIAHLNVLSLRSGVEVDPEDWSTHRTRYIGAIPAAGSRTIRWPVHAVNTGKIALYVAVLPQSGRNRPPAIGPTVQLVVAKRDTLNSGGILPLALGIPALLGLMAGGTHLARRRR
jgi:hypothetical protein